MYDDAPVILYSPKVMDENSKQFVHGKLTVTGNSFERPVCGKHFIHLEYLREAEFTNNSFDAPLRIETFCTGDVIKNNNIIKSVEL